jgi:enamine deaminase RidA (YjgF/YER057c/UK114 family)
MPAPGGAQPLTGNNPLAIATPSDGPRQVCENLKAAAEAAGGSLDDIVRVGAKMVSPEYLIEISAIAVLPDGWSTCGSLQ